MDSPAMHREQVWSMFLEDREKPLKVGWRIETKPRFNRKLDLGNRTTQGTQNGIDPLWFTKKAAASAFPVNNWRGTPKIQVHARNRILLQFCSSTKNENEPDSSETVSLRLSAWSTA